MLSGETSSPPGLIGPPQPDPAHHEAVRLGRLGPDLRKELFQIRPQQLRLRHSLGHSAGPSPVPGRQPGPSRPLLPSDQGAVPVDESGRELRPADIDGQRQVSHGICYASTGSTTPSAAGKAAQPSRRWKRERNQSRASADRRLDPARCGGRLRLFSVLRAGQVVPAGSTHPAQVALEPDGRSEHDDDSRGTRL